MNKKILFVDDEPQVLHALKRDFRKSPYKCFFAQSGPEGLEIIEREGIDLVVADMKMPGMDGYEFLQKVKLKAPHIISVILSGYTERETVYKSLINGTAQAYLSKPWDKESLENYITQLFAVKSALEDQNLLNIINSVSHLPTIEIRYQKILDLIKKGENLSKISKVIEEDPALTADVLKLANSAFYGQRVPISSVNRAVVFLGTNVIRDIVLSLGIINSFRKIGKAKIEINKFWEHANLCNKIINFLYIDLFQKKLPDGFSTVGLLHDIGRLFELIYFPEKFSQILERLESQPEIGWLEAEREIIGVPHTLLGGYLLNWWNFPYPLIEIAFFHHEPLKEGVINKEIAALVNIADFYADEILNITPRYPPEPEVFAFLKIEKESIEDKIKEFEEQGERDAAAT
ncbi:MAG: HDOD domain-containing protein [Candidatus Desulfofervidaceae bacterium]|nr:HDOD domain-containing protein [Candidatus Desulfofervidaceae bacterium]